MPAGTAGTVAEPLTLAVIMYKGPITWIVLAGLAVFAAIYFVSRRGRK